MATIITRETGATAKGSPLTNAEVDNNFINLNTQVSPSRSTVRPSMSLDFSNSTRIDTRVKSRRNTRASYIDKNGQIKLAPPYTPRLQYNPTLGETTGLLIEGQRTNYLYNTQNFALNWNFEYTAMPIRNAALAPDGTYSGLLLKSYQAATSARMITSIPSASGWTYSVYVKKGTANSFSIWVYSGGWILSEGFTWSNNVLSPDTTLPKIQYINNGWYRISMKFSTPGGGSLLMSPGPYGSNSITDSTYFWGAQLEAANFPSSYIQSNDTFSSRASNASYFDERGVLRYAGHNQLRHGYGYDVATNKWYPQGALFEAQATNLVPESVRLSTWATNGGSMIVSDNFTDAPDGTITASKVAASSSNVGHYIYTSVTSVGVVYTWSAYVKSAGHNYAIIHAHGVTQNIFDISTGQWSGSMPGDSLARGSQNIGNGWYRIWITFTATSGNVYIGGANNSSSYTYTGDGTNGIYIWGCQVEQGYEATSYIPTKNGTATRAADSCGSSQTTRAEDNLTVSAADFAKASGEDGFSFALEFYREGGTERTSYYEHPISVGGAQFFYDPYGEVNTYWLFNGAGQGQLGPINGTSLNKYSVSAKYSGNAYVSWNGSTSSLVTGSFQNKAAAQASNIGLGNSGNGGNPSFVTIKRLNIYSTTINTAELKALAT